MANSVTPSPQSTSPADEPVVLVASARFITRTESIPASVRPRDLSAYLEGQIEEVAPLPLEHISWGCLSETKNAGKERKVLVYAAAKELVFTNRRSTPQRPTLPAFAALYGVRVREPGWVFLADGASVAAVLLLPGQSLPARIHARFLEGEDEKAAWDARSRLVTEIKPAKNEKLLPGLVRVDEIRLADKRIDFRLKRQATMGAVWENWQQTRFLSQSFINLADLRERALLVAQQEKQRNSRMLKMVGLCLLVCALAIAGLETLLHRRTTLAAELAERAQKQQKTVREIQQMETMTKALEATLLRQSRPFELLAALNRKRPQGVYLKSMSSAEADQLRVGGEADNIQSVNNYTAELRKDPFWKEIDLAEVRTETSGAATFQLRLRADKDAALPPVAPPPAATEPDAPVQDAQPQAVAATTQPPAA